MITRFSTCDLLYFHVTVFNAKLKITSVLLIHKIALLINHYQLIN